MIEVGDSLVFNIVLASDHKFRLQSDMGWLFLANSDVNEAVHQYAYHLFTSQAIAEPLIKNPDMLPVVSLSFCGFAIVLLLLQAWLLFRARALIRSWMAKWAALSREFNPFGKGNAAEFEERKQRILRAQTVSRHVIGFLLFWLCHRLVDAAIFRGILP